jgi:primase-polymerase (primpol)-like protein
MNDRRAAAGLQAAQGPGSYPGQGSLPNAAPAAYLPPAWLAGARRWLLWCWGEQREDGKRAKVPYYAGGGMRRKTGTPEDLARLVTYDEAIVAAWQLIGVYAGLGFALGDGWQGIDLDSVRLNRLSDLANALPSYVELSPSGNGCHAIGFGRPFDTLAPDKTTGIEAYSHSRFFTFTGWVIRFGPQTCLADFVQQRLVTRHGGATHAGLVARVPDEPQTLDDDKVMRQFWFARNAEPFRALWLGDGLHRYGNDHSRADQALMTQLAFYTRNDAQLVRLFRQSALGLREKAYRDDYIDRTVAKARAAHAPRLAGIAAAMAAMGGTR